MTAIDMAEDAKMKLYSQADNELRIHKDRLSKVSEATNGSAASICHP